MIGSSSRERKEGDGIWRAIGSRGLEGWNRQIRLIKKKKNVFPRERVSFDKPSWKELRAWWWAPKGLCKIGIVEWKELEMECDEKKNPVSKVQRWLYFISDFASLSDKFMGSNIPFSFAPSACRFFFRDVTPSTLPLKMLRSRPWVPCTKGMINDFAFEYNIAWGRKREAKKMRDEKAMRGREAKKRKWLNQVIYVQGEERKREWKEEEENWRGLKNEGVLKCLPNVFSPFLNFIAARLAPCEWIFHNKGSISCFPSFNLSQGAALLYPAPRHSIWWSMRSSNECRHEYLLAWKIIQIDLTVRW